MVKGLAIAANEWKRKDWEWQQKNSLRRATDIPLFFPNFPQGEIVQIGEYEKLRRWGITPYTLSLMQKDNNGNPSPEDPLVRQTFPVRGFRLDNSPDSYRAMNIPNWELPKDMITPILQHKYTNKVILRAPNACLAYCGFCFEVERVEDRNSVKLGVTDILWKQSLDYIRNRQEIVEVILSGGDPLLSANNALESRLADIRSITHVRALRIHTRALSFNPFRFDGELVDILNRQRVTELGLHLCHPNELTNEAKEALELFDKRGYGSILKMGQTPLLKGVNDNSDVLRELFMKMYADFKIKPYYLLHDMPSSPAAAQYRTSVRRGVELINTLKRHIPNVAVPEYVIVHCEGKHTVPLEINGTSEFQYTQNGEGHPVIKFKNWKGSWETYLDGCG